MQTFRLCEQQLDLKPGFVATCNDPVIDAIKVQGLLASAAAEAPSTQSMRAMMFGGGHLRLRINTAIISHDDCPCSHAVHMVNALAILPLGEDNLTPAYLPNLTKSRTFNSVVLDTASGTDEDILWWHDEQLDVLNLECEGSQGFCGIRVAGLECTAECNQCVGVNTEAHASALYGRFTVEHKVKVRRRIDEGKALFLLTQFFSNVGAAADCPGWPFRRNVYFRYALRASR